MKTAMIEGRTSSISVAVFFLIAFGCLSWISWVYPLMFYCGRDI